jgi:uncharacterized protein
VTRYLRPGAYTERVDAAAPTRLQVRSDIPAFIGIAERGPLDTPVPVESFRQFQAHFGDFIGAGFLAYSVRAFFENGGQRCWIIRVAQRDSTPPEPGISAPGSGARAAAVIISNGSVPMWSIQASSPGTWGNYLAVSLHEENLADTAITTTDSDDFFIAVSSTAGFKRGSLVRVTQETSGGVINHFLRVVSLVDEKNQRLYWCHPVSGQGLAYDQPLTGLDKNRPARAVTLSYGISVFHQHTLLASYRNLELIPQCSGYGPHVLPALTAPVFTHGAGATPDAPAAITIHNLLAHNGSIPAPLVFDQLQRLLLTGGQDGLARLTHTDFIGESFSPEDSDWQRQQKQRGIQCLNSVDEITLVAIPDIVLIPEAEADYVPDPEPPENPCVLCPPAREKKQPANIGKQNRESPAPFTDEQIYQVQAALVEHCEQRGDRFAIIDPPRHCAERNEDSIAAIQAWRSRFDSHYAALYFPWIKVIEPRPSQRSATGSLVRSIPPSGHVLGQYAFFDNTLGVHRAPANRPLNWCQDLSLHTSLPQQEMFNPLGINVIRSEGSRGIRVMGARTLSSDPEWRYINVRRLLIMIRRTLAILTQWAVFEPNNHATRNKLQIVISTFLHSLWARGALSGAKPEQAFFIKCNEENNPAYQRSNGVLLTEIGVAPAYPFEFVIVRVGMQENELDIRESRDFASAA